MSGKKPFVFDYPQYYVPPSGYEPNEIRFNDDDVQLELSPEECQEHIDRLNNQ